MVIEFLHIDWYCIFCSYVKQMSLAMEHCVCTRLNPYLNPIHYGHLIKQMHQKADTIYAFRISTICCQISVNPLSWPSFGQFVFYGWSRLTSALLSQQCMFKVHSCYTLTSMTWASVWNATWHITCTRFKWFQVRQTDTGVHIGSGVWSTFE